MDAWPNWKGKCVPLGMWQWRKCCSPGAGARRVPGRKVFWSPSHELTETPPQLSQPLTDSVCLPLAASKTTRYFMEIVSPATQRWLFLGKSSRTVPHSCRDLGTPARYSSLFTWEGVCTPRVHLLWLFSLWGEGEGGEIIYLIYISLW